MSLQCTDKGPYPHLTLTPWATSVCLENKQHTLKRSTCLNNSNTYSCSSLKLSTFTSVHTDVYYKRSGQTQVGLHGPLQGLHLFKWVVESVCLHRAVLNVRRVHCTVEDSTGSLQSGGNRLRTNCAPCFFRLFLCILWCLIH